MEEEQNIINKKGLYDDCYYPLENYIEHKQIINKVDLFDAFSTDIIARYTHFRSCPPVPAPTHPHAPAPAHPHAHVQPPVPLPGQELRIGYILYIEADANINVKSKMNKLLNYINL
jgi:hypothetical protein